MSKNSHFRGPFDNQYAKLDQTLLKPEPQNLFHILANSDAIFSEKKSIFWIFLGNFEI